MATYWTHTIPHPEPPRSDLLALVRTWYRRAHERRALAELDEHLLRDCGLSRAEASHEAAKPFWRA
ncbi:MAG: DUF1127 domain-containing protein [Alphaproteobacteria bacterium]|jgi:uncharacterized protein YjiS (DUF1127 family)|nr:DUF1127 domain-containing protein [Alphaproteobacteria bacterium]